MDFAHAFNLRRVETKLSEYMYKEEHSAVGEIDSFLVLECKPRIGKRGVGHPLVKWGRLA